MAAAQQAAALALVNVRSLAEKQLVSSLASVPPLTDDTYDIFITSVKRVAFKDEWADWILDVATPHPGAPALTPKETCDERNAYMLVMKKVEGTQAGLTMEHPAVQMGDAKAAYIACHEFFYRSTAAGKQEATLSFYGATMRNTNTNIIGWIAIIPRRAALLVQAGGSCAVGDHLSLLISGLLP